MSSIESTGSLELEAKKGSSLDGVERQDSIISNMFGRSTDKVKRNKTDNVSIKIRVYIVLHKPVGNHLLYHIAILLLIFLSVMVVNLYDEDLSNRGDNFSDYLLVKVITDSLLISNYPNPFITIQFIDDFVSVILTLELMARLWSCDCVTRYQGVGGRCRYWKDYWFNRTLELFGVIVFSAFIINFMIYKDREFDSNIRLAHLTQVLQCYRILFRILRLMILTITSQQNQIIIVMIFAILNLIICSLTLYLCERETNPKIDRISDAFWLTFVTFTTIG